MSIFTNSISAAAEEARAYIAAVLELLGDQDPIPVLQQTPDRIRRVITGPSADELRRPERAGKWSVVEVVQHLADSDLVWGYRMRSVLAEDRPTLTGYDQDLWATQLRYREADPAEALEEFQAIRAANLRLLARVPPQDLERVGIHSERGEEGLDHMIRLYAGHDLVHRQQLERILSGVSGAR